MKDMEYISMERAVELGKDGYFHMEFDRAGPHTGYEFSAVELHALCNAAIADYLNGVGDGVELPEPSMWLLESIPGTPRQWYWSTIIRLREDLAPYESDPGQRTEFYAVDQLRQAIAHYAARLKQAEDVLRMAREALTNANSGYPCPLFADALEATNQQLGEK